jgi:hypothetical protein
VRGLSLITLVVMLALTFAPIGLWLLTVVAFLSTVINLLGRHWAALGKSFAAAAALLSLAGGSTWLLITDLIPTWQEAGLW